MLRTVADVMKSILSEQRLLKMRYLQDSYPNLYAHFVDLCFRSFERSDLVYIRECAANDNYKPLINSVYDDPKRAKLPEFIKMIDELEQKARTAKGRTKILLKKAVFALTRAKLGDQPFPGANPKIRCTQREISKNLIEIYREAVKAKSDSMMPFYDPDCLKQFKEIVLEAYRKRWPEEDDEDYQKRISESVEIVDSQVLSLFSSNTPVSFAMEILRYKHSVSLTAIRRRLLPGLIAALRRHPQNIPLTDRYVQNMLRASSEQISKRAVSTPKRRSTVQ